MFNTEELIIVVFCCMEDCLNEIIQGKKIRASGFEPKLNDSEVITMEIVGEVRSLDQDIVTASLKENCSREFLRLLTRFRRLIEQEGRRGNPAMTNRVVETIIGQLSTRFNIENV